MSINVDKIKRELNLSPFGQKGWMGNKIISCPDCGRSGKFGINITNRGGGVHCFYCDFSENIYKYLKRINRSDLISNEIEISMDNKIKSLFNDIENNISEKEVFLPKGVKRIFNDEYLNKRGFLKEHYNQFEPCYTDFIIEHSLKNYIIFKLKQNNKLIGWLARSRKNYEWHKQNLKKYKSGEGKLVLRYKNNPGSEFDKMLGGYDDITNNTITVILVEGLFDKVGIDNKLRLFEGEKVRCVFTFGNKISNNQIKLLRKKKNIKNIILLYDYGTIKQSKSQSLRLKKYFNVEVTIPIDEKDANDMSVEELIDTLNRCQDPINFFINNLNNS